MYRGVWPAIDRGAVKSQTRLSIAHSTYTHQRYWPILLFFGSVFVWFWFQGDSGFIECLWECSFLCGLLEEFGKDQCKFFVFLVEFPSEATWSWTSVCREFLFNFLCSICSVYLFLFFIQFWWAACF